jgi:nucleotide-binding universal stress UspA family protein
MRLPALRTLAAAALTVAALGALAVVARVGVLDGRPRLAAQTIGAADALLDVAERVGAEMIVVGNKGMHGTRRLLIGSVPNTVSHRARCNVLIVATDQD